MKYLSAVLILLVLFSCNSNTSEEQANKKPKEKIEYDMYVASEMTLLMNKMHDINLQVKQDILDGKTPTEFPEEILNIHTAVLSEFKSRNDRFQAFSDLFVQSEKEIFNEESSVDIKTRYNNAINLCVSCHQTECTGPIPKIKKLLIK